jgi:hypothetical protein
VDVKPREIDRAPRRDMRARRWSGGGG